MSSAGNKNTDAKYYIDGVLGGNIAVLSKAITIVESSRADHKTLATEIISGVQNHSGKSFRLGITGVPGVGKSTFIESFGKALVQKGHKLAVLAIDPSSNKSKGSILGDKTRMEFLATHPDVFIRPSPSGGTLGGLAAATYQTMLLCEAAGFDFIIIETVGVGQSEVAVSRITDFFLLLMLAGAGDELQGIKRGIMEMADALVITKADGTNINKANAARAEYQRAMHLLQQPESGVIPQVLTVSSTENTGIEEVYTMLEKYQRNVVSSGYFKEKREKQQHELLLSIIDEVLKEKFFSDSAVKTELEKLNTHSKPNFNPFALAEKIVSEFFKKSK